MQAPRIVALCSIGHTAALGALAGVLRARVRPAPARTSTARPTRRSAPSPRACAATSAGSTRVTSRCCSRAARPTRCCRSGVFPCADGYVSMMSTPQQLGEMLSVIDDDALPRGVRPSRRVRRTRRPRRSSTPRSTRGCSSTPAPRRRRGPGRGVAAGRGLRPAEVLEADHLHQRGFWVDVDDPTVGPVLLPGPPYRHAEGGWRLHRPAPPRRPDDAAGTVRARPRGAVAPADGPHRSGGAAAAGDPRPRLHHRVVGAVPHAAARRPRRRGDPGREPVGVPAHDQGVPAAAGPEDAARQPPLDVRAGGGGSRRTDRTTVTR